jgi:hypothetical protein
MWSKVKGEHIIIFSLNFCSLLRYAVHARTMKCTVGTFALSGILILYRGIGTPAYTYLAYLSQMFEIIHQYHVTFLDQLSTRLKKLN